MKDMLAKAVEKHTEYIAAQTAWNVSRRELQKKLTEYVRTKESEIKARFGIKTNVDMFLTNLDGGSAVASWKPEPFFSRITIGEDAFEPIVGGNWAKIYFEKDGYNITCQEVSEGPLPIAWLKEMCRYMTEQTGIQFTVYEREIDENEKQRYEKYINLDGSIVERKEEPDYED